MESGVSVLILPSDLVHPRNLSCLWDKLWSFSYFETDDCILYRYCTVKKHILTCVILSDGSHLIAAVGSRVLMYDAADGDLLHSLKGSIISLRLLRYMIWAPTAQTTIESSVVSSSDCILVLVIWKHVKMRLLVSLDVDDGEHSRKSMQNVNITWNIRMRLVSFICS